jgi:hypothetical protein
MEAFKASSTVMKVQWFLDNINLQIDERRLREAGRTTLTFFDTAGVRAALLGMDNFLTESSTFDLKAFNKKSSLVYALAAAGWLGPMHMLLPHQNELRILANLDFGTELHGQDLRVLMHRFLQALAINQEILDAKKIKGLDHEAAIRFVRDNVGSGSAEKLFKAIQFIRGTWRTRLIGWLKTKQLLLSDEDFDLADVMGGMTFQRLKQSFGRFRRDKSETGSEIRSWDVSNSVDALALAELAKKLRRLNSEGAPSVPVLFSPDGFFEKVIKKAGLESRFSYINDEGSRLSSIRGPDYFIFKAIFDPPDLVRSTDSKFVQASMTELRELRERVSSILKAQCDLEEALTTTTGLGGKPLGKLIEEIRTLSFFENVWLPLSPSSLEEVEHELQEAAEGLRSPEFRRAADEALTRAKQEIDAKTKTYEQLTSLWHRVAAASKLLQNRIKAALREGRQNRKKNQETEPPKELDPFLHFALLRFSLPNSSHSFIRSTISALVSGNFMIERDAQRKILGKYRSVRSDSPQSLELLSELSGVFWCLNLDQDLISMLESCKPLRHFSLDMILIASYFRLNQNVGKGNLLLKELTERYSDLPPNKMGQLMIGLGYLYFHLILCLDLVPDQTNQEAMQELYENAVRCARMARDLLTDSPSQVYALNNYLYYMVESSDDRYLSEMRWAAEELKKWIDKPGVWQYRFDDTLARYYDLVSTHAADKRTRKLARDQALDFIDRAWVASLGDPEILRFRGDLAHI